MKTEKWVPLAAFAALLVTASSCQDWGQQDPKAGNQVYPTLQNVAKYDFQIEEGLDPAVYRMVAYPDGEMPDVVDDEEMGKVLEVNHGALKFSNPLTTVVLQNAASLTFWLKVDGTESLSQPLISFEDEIESTGVSVAADGTIRYKAADGEWLSNGELADYVTPGEWHFMAMALTDTGYTMVVDGENTVSKQVTDFDCSKIVSVANAMPDLTIGSIDNNTKFYVDDLTVFRNTITEKECRRPNLNGGGGGGAVSSEPVTPVYFNSFDASLGGCTIKGGGEIKYVGGAFGNVFSNAMDGMRQNYLVLPEDVLSHSAETEALTISVWVNRGNETVSSHYMWSPLFTAYGAEATENTWPMLACQYRGVLQVNNGTWSDYTDDQNVKGVNGVYHDATDWLADGNWHYYTATFTPTTAKVYFDGEIVNEWEIDGVANSAAGMFANGGDFHHICLGGNQAWNWGDPDPGFWFDDIAIYNQELSQEQIKTVMNLKNTMYANTFSNGADDMEKKGAGEFIDNSTPGFGKIFKNAVGGMRENYLLLPSTALKGCAETSEFTLNVWLNSTDAGDYYWNPVFTAYAESPGGNGCPMFACQYRGVISINTNGPDNSGGNWCDYGADTSDTGEVILYHGDRDWLADKNWHLYTVVCTPTNTVVYFDGEVANSWTLDGVTAGQVCDVAALANMTCICLGGNQAWGWSDPDPGFGFDDIFLYNRALSQNEVKQLMLLKK